MSGQVITAGVWSAITRAAKGSKRPSHVAVAYLGQGGARMLPLARGSRLVVDASESAVRSGQTCPSELAKLYRRGVLVYSCPGLHAKVFVFGSRAFVGSANVSKRSRTHLIEAAVETRDRSVVRECRSFVLGLCVQEIGPERIKALETIYKPPRVSGPRSRASVRIREGAPARRVLVVNLPEEDPPDTGEEAAARGLKKARQRMKAPRRHTLDEFWCSGSCPYRRGDVVLQILQEQSGQAMVYPPGTVVHVERAPGAVWYVYVEYPEQNRRNFKRLGKQVGRKTAARLKRDGVLGRDFAERVLDVWKPLK